MTGERLLIINADDYGMCHSTNRAIATLLAEGAVTSASLMMTCPWLLEAVSFLKRYPRADVGVHLTHTSEWEHYKWGPLNCRLSTLVDENGYFPADTRSVIHHADPEELREEATAQIEFALRLGIDITNIDNHMGSMYHVTEILLELCEKYALPLRYPKHERKGALLQYPQHERLVQRASQIGVLLPDYIEMLPFFPPAGAAQAPYTYTKEAAVRIIKGLKPGLTELILHPSLDTEELKAITGTWQLRRYDFDVFRDEEIKRLLRDEDIRLITWREIRDMQRS
ncbi:polysaccharide deacetylase family protein [Paenibacillus hamazuiensis]|uniref:polysaccharide deacetylase family protein n=1 Tax=Paenibacillus hamazuiensis TaxID=2936508 RepID=UPI00200E9CEE|nr:polysaccharide deacetylase family protein [Paenibacillus hamazuiensis]